MFAYSEKSAEINDIYKLFHYYVKTDWGTLNAIIWESRVRVAVLGHTMWRLGSIHGVQRYAGDSIDRTQPTPFVLAAYKSNCCSRY